MKLDGNVIGGVMLEVFGSDMTTAGSVCGSCGAHEEMARLDVYLAAGIVVRCHSCEAVMIRIVQGVGRTWVDLSGTASLQLS
jgi:Family of unknown function (DUF6510)